MLFAVMKDWLESQGFKTASWGDGKIFDYGMVYSLFGTQQEIQIHINETDGEVAELYCRFSIPNPSKWSSPLQRWGDFFDEFIGRFPLRFSDDQEQCDRARFEAAVLADENYVAISNAVR